jgi:hypothetical protein
MSPCHSIVNHQMDISSIHSVNSVVNLPFCAKSMASAMISSLDRTCYGELVEEFLKMLKIIKYYGITRYDYNTHK